MCASPRDACPGPLASWSYFMPKQRNKRAIKAEQGWSPPITVHPIRPSVLTSLGFSPEDAELAQSRVCLASWLVAFRDRRLAQMGISASARKSKAMALQGCEVSLGSRRVLAAHAMAQVSQVEAGRPDPKPYKTSSIKRVSANFFSEFVESGFVCSENFKNMHWRHTFLSLYWALGARSRVLELSDHEDVKTFKRHYRIGIDLDFQLRLSKLHQDVKSMARPEELLLLH